MARFHKTLTRPSAGKPFPFYIRHLCHKQKTLLKECLLFLSGIPESNRRHHLGKVAYCHYTNPAFFLLSRIL